MSHGKAQAVRVVWNTEYVDQGWSLSLSQLQMINAHVQVLYEPPHVLLVKQTRHIASPVAARPAQALEQELVILC